ncbi:serpin family protein [Alkalicoccobacillus murimartini]|uniref:Serpin B n=1 Tax=Alkalicoccobacillus murimartini TaxID=171685 RepID=A0ABT9YBP9_9BACI|nr:serpin family protein [Alkalicoccobacillus murimartini]MDQ0205263.1 serpin B [Alkalicoccobacillus murimartini]
MRLRFFILGFFVVTSAGCGTLANQEEEKPQAPDPSPEEVKYEPASAQSTFGVELFQEVYQNSLEENMLISPYSVQLALLMTANGLADEERKTLLESLQLGDRNLDELNREVQKITESFDSLPHAELKTAHSVWHKKGLDVEDDYQELLHTFYNGEIREISESEPAKEINDWVNDNTDGYISELLDEVPMDTVAYLINAVYFDANWKEPFEENLTKPGPFHLLNGETIEHPMMNQTGEFALFEESTFRALKLPYEDDGFSMAIILPGEDEFEEVAHSFSPAVFWTDLWRDVEVDVSLPTFTFSADYSLVPALSELGMGSLFNGGLDFSPMFGSGFSYAINDVIHKTFINVDEEGTEAAAVTAVDLRESATMIENSFIVNRPFIFAIIDENTETILFIGSVERPVLE